MPQLTRCSPWLHGPRPAVGGRQGGQPRHLGLQTERIAWRECTVLSGQQALSSATVPPSPAHAPPHAMAPPARRSNLHLPVLIRTSTRSAVSRPSEPSVACSGDSSARAPALSLSFLHGSGRAGRLEASAPHATNAFFGAAGLSLPLSPPAAGAARGIPDHLAQHAYGALQDRRLSNFHSQRLDPYGGLRRSDDAGAQTAGGVLAGLPTSPGTIQHQQHCGQRHGPAGTQRAINHKPSAPHLRRGQQAVVRNQAGLHDRGALHAHGAAQQRVQVGEQVPGAGKEKHGVGALVDGTATKLSRM